MTLTKRISLREFHDIKDFLSNLDDGYYSDVNNYVVAYVLLRNHGYKATKINAVNIDMTNDTVVIDFEIEYHKEGTFQTEYLSVFNND
jgi:hypothetical protein